MMGCSMELWAEVRATDGWNKTAAFVHDDLFQNYDCFAVMAGVRDYHGYEPIFRLRGAPPDYRPCEYDDVRGPTSWLTAAEIMAFDWTKMVHKTGILKALFLPYWWKYNRPCGRPDSEVTEIRQGESYDLGGCRPFDDIFAEVEAWEQNNPGRSMPKSLGEQKVVIEWDEPYSIAGQYLLTTLLPQMWRLGKPDDLRIVFEFS